MAISFSWLAFLLQNSTQVDIVLKILAGLAGFGVAVATFISICYDIRRKRREAKRES